jgi:hypothetical protein
VPVAPAPPVAVACTNPPSVVQVAFAPELFVAVAVALQFALAVAFDPLLPVATALTVPPATVQLAFAPELLLALAVVRQSSPEVALAPESKVAFERAVPEFVASAIDPLLPLDIALAMARFAAVALELELPIARAVAADPSPVVVAVADDPVLAFDRAPPPCALEVADAPDLAFDIEIPVASEVELAELSLPTALANAEPPVEVAVHELPSAPVKLTVVEDVLQTVAA